MTTDRTYPNSRTAVVTGVGAPRGIGRVVARQLAAEGWALALVDVDPKGAAEIEAELASVAIVEAVATDISSPESVAAAFEVIDAELPPVVGLVNLAGVPSPVPLLELSAKDWDRVMAVNVTGSFLIPRTRGQLVITFTTADGGEAAVATGGGGPSQVLLGKRLSKDRFLSARNECKEDPGMGLARVSGHPSGVVPRPHIGSARTGTRNAAVSGNTAHIANAAG